MLEKIDAKRLGMQLDNINNSLLNQPTPTN